MASGNYAAKKVISPEPAQTPIPLRANATRQLPVVEDSQERVTRPLSVKRPTTMIVVNEFAEVPLTNHNPWLRRIVISIVVVVIAILVLISAGWYQRPGPPNLIIASNAQVFPIQVGGTLGAVNA